MPDYLDPTLWYLQIVPYLTSLIQVGAALALYILGALGTCRLAQRRGLKRPWLAWIPVANDYLYGELSDEVTAWRRMGRKTKYRILLPALSGAAIGSYILLIVLMIVVLVSILSTVDPLHPNPSQEKLAVLIGMSFLLMVFAMILALVAMVSVVLLSVFISIALYPVYREFCSQGAALAFAVCGGIFGLHGVFLFAIRNKQPIPPCYM